MAFKLWQMDRLTAGVRMARGNLLPVLRILVESASLQFVVETILLGLYAANNNAQYILLEIVTPLVVSTCFSTTQTHVPVPYLSSAPSSWSSFLPLVSPVLTSLV